jgi:phosphoribosylformylglycinamidine synthase
MATITKEVYHSMGLRDSEYDLILQHLGRTPTLTEVGMFAVMWSEHCGYKYSRPILRYFSRYKAAMDGGGHENAGVVDIGDNLGVVMKVESHNHPSAVEPYQGAATGVGGIIRDIFTMGARPIAALNSLRFGPIRDGEGSPEEIKRNRFLFDGVVHGISGYGNCVGVPTVGGEVMFHPSYSGRPLVNAMCVGLVELDQIATAGAGGLGNPVIYLGSETGKDGIHGATFASEELEDEDQSKRPNVQIGDPFAEKQLIEATLEALKTGAIHSIQDMGAAGLTCSTIEMSAKGGVGMEVDLDLVPMRESDMSGYELMLSESQERMLCVAHKGREQEVLDVFHKWGVHAVVIGHVTDTNRVRVTRHGELIADVPAKALADECPTYVTEPVVPGWIESAKQFDPATLPPVDHAEAMKRLALAPTLASKKWVFQQYDHQVQTQTALLPGVGDAAVLAPRGTQKGLAVKIDGNGRWVNQDPYNGGMLVVAEAARNVACTGGRPVAVTDGLNYGNPEIPENYWIFERSVKGLADACEAMQTPVISGNVSFYNHGDRGAVLPTPMIGMLGILEDASKRVGFVLPKEPVDLYLVSYQHSSVPQHGLGASAYLAEVHGKEDGIPVPPDMAKERVLCDQLADWVAKGAILAAHDISEGGLAFALAEMLGPQQLGADVTLPKLPDFVVSDTGWLFGEFPGWVIVAVAQGAETPKVQNQVLNLNRLGESNSTGILHVKAESGSILNISSAEWFGWHTNCLTQITGTP